MLLAEILQKDDQLEEGKFSNALAAGTIAAASMLPSHLSSTSQLNVDPSVGAEYQHKLNLQALVDTVISKYNVSKQFAQRVVGLPDKYAKPTFPRAEDILAIVGIESSFDPTAVSHLKHDPAVGLMQVRPKIWDVNPTVLKHNIEAQIHFGSSILNKYYNKLGSKDAAVHAYNVGLRNHLTGGRTNPGYVKKYRDELQLYM